MTNQAPAPPTDREEVGGQILRRSLAPKIERAREARARISGDTTLFAARRRKNKITTRAPE